MRSLDSGKSLGSQRDDFVDWVAQKTTQRPGKEGSEGCWSTGWREEGYEAQNEASEAEFPSRAVGAGRWGEGPCSIGGRYEAGGQETGRRQAGDRQETGLQEPGA
jgi:hypothetical protein